MEIVENGESGDSPETMWRRILSQPQLNRTLYLMHGGLKPEFCAVIVVLN
jgi:hypothetical protein